MLRIGLTGGIGTGKSHVARRLAVAGVPVVDADRLARDVVGPGTAGLEAIRRRFGPAVIAQDGSLLRKDLAAVVFADAEARRDLEAIIHPAVRAGIEAFFVSQPIDTPFAVADIPLLYETGRQREFDAVVVAACPPEMQIARVMSRDGASEAEVRERMAAQLPIEEKVRRADYVIDTSGSLDDTDAAVSRVVDRLRQRARPVAGESA
ncbi:MAG TPA: dephospho-CoA kinase [Vicinamibacterales bacterium]|nr:dephospho-CoA kinase [Vicinamibacterales bacterium]